MMISEEKIADIKHAADIVDIVSEVVVIKKAGKNYQGLCPFHTEKTPSFTVSPQKQIYYCFGCGAGGDVFEFLQKHGGLTFVEAARTLARRYGIELPHKKLSPQQRQALSDRERLLAVNRYALEFYTRTLTNGPRGQRAREYLDRRGLSTALTEQFNVGYAAPGWRRLHDYLLKKRIPPGLVEKAGLIIKKSGSDGYYDRFRERIIFPIYNLSKQVIGFGGRVMDDSLPKYLNSPETLVFSKSRALYGVHLSKQHCRLQESAFVVEGYFDLLALFQHGIKNSVATLGTSLTAEHVKLLRGFIGRKGRVILVFDSDAAGLKAAKRSIAIFNQGHVEARILVLPPGHDPDSYLAEFGSHSFLDQASQAQGIFPFLMDCAEKEHGMSMEGKIRIIADMQAPLGDVGDSVLRSLYVKTLAEKTGIAEEAILSKVRESMAAQKHPTDGATPRGMTAQKPSAGAGPPKAPPEGVRLERKIVAMMMQFADILGQVRDRKVLTYFQDNTLKAIGRLILEYPEAVAQGAALLDVCQDDNQRRLIAALSLEEDFWSLDQGCKLISQFIQARAPVRKDRLIAEIRAAEKNNDHELLIKLLMEKQRMAQQDEGQKTVSG